MRRFRFLRDPAPDALGETVEAFLAELGGPSCIFLEGEDSSRTRAFVTLLHGNEPSGAMALHRWLRAGRRPAVNLLCIVASVSAALQQPLFSQRMLHGARDLNRCFREPFADEQGRLAEEILELLHLHHPESVVDMHNTSGSGPAFGVCTFEDRQHAALLSLFTDRAIVARLTLGALMEISEFSYPTVTVEVGGRADPRAHAIAWEGLERYFTAPRVLAADPEGPPMRWLLDPIRLELNNGVSLAYAPRAAPEADVTLLPDVERLNFGHVGPDTQLGWARGAPRSLFRARDSGGRCAVERLVRVAEGKLFAARRLQLFMITANPDIAQTDCLFYAVEDGQGP